MEKRNTGEIIFNVFNILFMLFIIVVMTYPMLYVAFSSLSEPNQLIRHQGMLFAPLGFSLGSYKAVLKNQMITYGYINTAFVVVVGVAINILLSSLGAYFLSRKNVMWKNIIMFVIVFTMFFGGGLIPFYFTVKELGMYNSLWSLIIPSAISTYNMIIMRTSFAGIPDSLEESAKLDGANHFSILFRIILPLSKAVIAVMVLYYAVGHWNAWFNAMIFLQDRKLYPLQLVLREILLKNDVNSMTQNLTAVDQEAVGETIRYSVIMVATLPILCVYPFLQKYFVKGVLIGAVKG